MQTPKRLSTDGAKRFKQLAKELDGLLPIDSSALALWVEAEERYLAAQATLKTQGRYNQVGTNGALQLHPAASDEKAALDAMLKLSRRLGLDPESRGKLSVNEGRLAKQPDDGIGEFVDE